MILDEILEFKATEVTERSRRVPLDEVRRAAADASPPRSLRLDGRMGLIAEVKRRSPSAGEIAREIDPVTQARLYEAGGASAISVLTDTQYFGGTLDDLRAVRAAVSLPVLCKDFVVGEYQVYEARAAGADIILLIMAALPDPALRPLLALVQELGMTPLVEVHTQHDLARAIVANAPVIGINNRDLTDFSVELVTTEYLAPLVPDGVTVISESGIVTRDDVDRVARAGAHAVLVGETLMRADDPAAAIAILVG